MHPYNGPLMDYTVFFGRTENPVHPDDRLIEVVRVSKMPFMKAIHRFFSALPVLLRLFWAAAGLALFTWAYLEYVSQRAMEAQMIARGTGPDQLPTAFGQEFAVAITCLGLICVIFAVRNR